MSLSQELHKSFKNDFSPKDLRDRRVQTNLQFRKKRRSDHFSSKRRHHNPEENYEQLLEDIEMLDVSKKKCVVPLEVLKSFFSANVYEQLDALHKVYRFLRRNYEEAIDDLVKRGLVSRIVQMLQSGSKTVQLQASNVLEYISEHSVGDILPSTTFKVLAEVLATTTDDMLKERIIIITGNITVESASLRSQVFESIFPAVLVKILETCNQRNLIQSGVFALSSLCMDLDPSTDTAKTAAFVPVLANLLGRWNSAVVIDSCFALSCLCESSKNLIQQIVDAKVPALLVELLGSQDLNGIVSSAINVLGKIVSGNESQTQAVIDSQALPALKRLLHSDNNEVVMNVCWVISNITAGTSHQIQSVVDANIFPDILAILRRNDFKTITEAAWVIKQAVSTRRTSVDQMDYLASIGCGHFLNNLLTSNCNETVFIALRALDTFLLFGFEVEQIVKFNDIQMLASSADNNVQKYAKRLLNHLNIIRNEQENSASRFQA